MTPPLDTLAENQLLLFQRQYFQLLATHLLSFPIPELLRDSDFQSALYLRIFKPGILKHPPPNRYELRVLKGLMLRVETSILDFETHGISDELMLRLTDLLVLPQPPEYISAQEQSFVTYTFTHPSFHASEITLLESPSLISFSGTTGFRTWEAALHLGKYLFTDPGRLLIRGKRVLELGAGTGLLAILCSKYLGAAKVMATDGTEQVAKGIENNLFLNGLSDSGAIEAQVLFWGAPEFAAPSARGLFSSQWDVVIGADVIFDQTVIPWLVATVVGLLSVSAHCQILIAATVRNDQTYSAFLSACRRQSYGF
ncbi:MAG: hypothetical protein M1829_006403 [Trizodia sp. TS-e1964]|nr:MAG: hypothetical protein M1829_006403 [Trizodia sp. TS-e1964]